MCRAGCYGIDVRLRPVQSPDLTTATAVRLVYRKKTIIATLQRVQNAAIRKLLNLRSRDSISDGLRQLQWLPIASRIPSKLSLLVPTSAHHTPVRQYNLSPIIQAVQVSGQQQLLATFYQLDCEQILDSVHLRLPAPRPGPRSGYIF